MIEWVYLKSAKVESGIRTNCFRMYRITGTVQELADLKKEGFKRVKFKGYGVNIEDSRTGGLSWVPFGCWIRQSVYPISGKAIIPGEVDLEYADLDASQFSQWCPQSGDWNPFENI